MSNIQFEEGYNQINNQYYRGASNERGLTVWMINKGIVKNARSAQLILLVVALLCFGAAFILINKNNTPRRTTNTGPAGIPAFMQDAQNQ